MAAITRWSGFRQTRKLALARQNLAPYPNVHLVGIGCRDARLAIENPRADSCALRVPDVDGHAEGACQGRSPMTLGFAHLRRGEKVIFAREHSQTPLPVPSPAEN